MSIMRFQNAEGVLTCLGSLNSSGIRADPKDLPDGDELTPELEGRGIESRVIDGRSSVGTGWVNGGESER